MAVSGEKSFSKEPASYDIIVDAALMNTARRTYGPTEASGFEYSYGYQLKRGRVRLDVSYSLPVDKKETEYRGPEAIINKLYSPRNHVLYPLQNPSSPSTYTGYIATNAKPSNGMIPDHDFRCRLSVGVSDRVNFSTTLELRNDIHVTDTTEYGFWYDIDRHEPIEQNKIYALELAVSFNDPARRRFTVGLNGFGQTDKNTIHSARTDVVIFLNWQLAF